MVVRDDNLSGFPWLSGARYNGRTGPRNDQAPLYIQSNASSMLPRVIPFINDRSLTEVAKRCPTVFGDAGWRFGTSCITRHPE